jgi:TatA/E family protein of Tat protein translocase
MFGPLGFPEMLFIVVLALLIFGPKRLPEVGRTIGKGMAQFRKATSDLKRTIETEIALETQEPRLPGRTTPTAAQPRQAQLPKPRSLPPVSDPEPVTPAPPESAAEGDADEPVSAARAEPTAPDESRFS